MDIQMEKNMEMKWKLACVKGLQGFCEQPQTLKSFMTSENAAEVRPSPSEASETSREGSPLWLMVCFISFWVKGFRVCAGMHRA